MTLDYLFRARCERIAVEWRCKLGGRKAFDPLPSAELLKELQITVVSPADIDVLSTEQRQQLASLRDWSAGIIRLAPIIVLCDPTHSPARHESDMMHECAHIILKHPMIMLDPFSPDPPGDPQCEAEAAYLGGCLQIPKRGLLWAIQRRMNVEQTAIHFGASVEMVRYRANMTGQRKQIEAV